MTTPDSRSPRPVALTDREAAALDRLRTADLYADRAKAARDDDPRLALLPLLRAASGRTMSQVFAHQMQGTEPDHRPDDVEAALALIRCARAAVDHVEGGLLLAARQAGGDGKPLLTFRRIADALGVESEQAAQGRYQRRVGNLNGSDSGLDGTP